MRRPLPSIEHVARALLVQGARDAAIDLLEASIARGGEERGRCEGLLGAVRSRPHDRVSGPPLPLDAALVETLASHGRLVEAWAVTRGASVGNTVAGVEIAEALADVMKPVDAPDAWRSRWMDVVANGSLAGIAAIEREILQGASVPATLVERLRIASRLLRGYWSARAEEEPGVLLPVDVRKAARERLDQRDLAGALAVVRSAAETSQGAVAVAMALARLVAATERLVGEEASTGGPTHARTQPLEGAGLALLQVRMGNFEDAERGFRRLVTERAADHVSRDRLSDLLVVRRAMEATLEADASPEGLALAKTPSPDWLNKRARRASVEGWASSTRSRPAAPPTWSDDDQSTSVIRPDEEAELHVKAGSPEKALPIYRKLVAKYPDRPRFSARLAEIEAMLAARDDHSDTEPPPAPSNGSLEDSRAAARRSDTVARALPVDEDDATLVRVRSEGQALEADAPSFDDRTPVEAWSSVATTRATVTVRPIVRVG